MSGASEVWHFSGGAVVSGIPIKQNKAWVEWRDVLTEETDIAKAWLLFKSCHWGRSK